MEEDIKTKRLCITKFDKHHITQNYINWLNDKQVTRFSNQRFKIHTKESTIKYLKNFEISENCFLAIERIEDRHFMGTATIYRNLNHGTADIGIMIGDRSCWGNGFGGEAWKAILEKTLNEDLIRKVTGGAVALNIGMVAIMKKSGMKLEAVRKDHEIIDGIPTDIVYFAKFSTAKERRKYRTNCT